MALRVFIVKHKESSLEQRLFPVVARGLTSTGAFLESFLAGWGWVGGGGASLSGARRSPQVRPEMGCLGEGDSATVEFVLTPLQPGQHSLLPRVSPSLPERASPTRGHTRVVCPSLFGTPSRVPLLYGSPLHDAYGSSGLPRPASA